MASMKALVIAVTLALNSFALPQDDPNEDDFQCLSSFHAYDTSKAEYELSSTIITYTTYVYESISYDKNVPMTTLCDGRARALRSYDTHTLTITTTYDEPASRVEYSTYTEPEPTCTIAETACTPILETYSSSYSDWASNNGPYPTGQPHCTTTAPEPTPTYTTCGENVSNCYLYGGRENKLYYWPVTTIDGDFCAQNGSTITPTPTDPNGAPNTAVIDGYTFTSPTNYFSLETAYGVLRYNRPRAERCGTGHLTNAIVPLTGSFSSTRAYLGDSGPYSFNFADLASPVPAPAWDGQWACNLAAQTGACDPIVGTYVPLVQMPTQVRDLEPEWKRAGCKGTVTRGGLGIQTYVALGVEETGAPGK